MRPTLGRLEVVSRQHIFAPPTGYSWHATSLRLCGASCSARWMQTWQRPRNGSRCALRALTAQPPGASAPLSRRLYSTYLTATGSGQKAFSVPLVHRGLIAIVGPDAAKFLQGLTTNNIAFNVPAASSELPIAQCNAFLNAQGRILQDALIYTLPPTSPLIQRLAIEDPKAATSPETPCFLVEVDRTQIPTLLKTLKRYKLRSKIVLRQVDAEQIGIVFHTGLATGGDSTFLEAVQKQNLFCARDERSPGLGYRILAPPDGLEALSIGTSGSVDDYRVHRYAQGVPEGQDELQPEHAMVQESNLDLMSGVDFRKGCYVGQELVIRTQHTGVVRKRVLPVLLYGSGTAPPEQLPDTIDPSAYTSLPFGTDIKPLGEVNTAGRRNRSAGKLIANVGNVGIALARLENMAGLGLTGETVEGWQSPEFALDAGTDDDANPRVKAFVPEWWASRQND